jgi:hypothetical protein
LRGSCANAHSYKRLLDRGLRPARIERDLKLAHVHRFHEMMIETRVNGLPLVPLLAI